VPRRLPWLLGGVMLVVYWATLNHWINLRNISQVATVSGWIWWPQVQNPLLFLVTLPFRCLPLATVPQALNLFSALCSAATLAVLARTVAILPHDRTEMERMRERSDFSFLSGWAAWAPPIAAVVFAGCQLTFWENATSFNGESLELLWFAVILWQLLEHRLDEREGRLYLAAGLFGAGLVENWGLLGFTPAFLMMIIWLRGLSFFNLQFLTRLTGWGLAGILVLLLLVVPLMARFSGVVPEGMWDAIKFILKNDWQVARLLGSGEVRHSLALISLTSLLPAFLMALRWSASFGDSSRMGATLVNYLMHGFNAVILGVLLWVTFDPPLGPRQLLQPVARIVPAWSLSGLTLAYVSALCLGYYSGYFLLIFGQEPARTRRTAKPEPALPESLVWLCPIIVLVVLAALGLGASLLVYKNAPLVQAINGDSLRKFGQFTAQSLPKEGAIVICDRDDAGPPIRAYVLHAELARAGRAQQYPVVDTHSLDWPQYHKYLHQQYPNIWPQHVTTNEDVLVTPWQILGLFTQLATNRPLCYVNPSFGYYFEKFYLEPHGLVYSLKPLPEDTQVPPPLDRKLIDENDALWREVLAGSRPAIESALHPRAWTKQAGLAGQALQRLHVPAESNPNAVLVGTYYSRGLDFLGVQFQRSGELTGAAGWFRDALALNSNNVAASINLDFNKELRAGAPAAVNLSRVITDQFGKYHDWNDVIAANGPFDETSFCYAYGVWLVQATPKLMIQAIAQFNRVRQLAPDNLGARLFLARLYNLNHNPERALEALHDPLARPFRFGLTEYNTTELKVVAATAHFQKNEDAAGAELLESEMERHPDDENLLFFSAQTFDLRGLYTNALRAINRKLATAPNDPTWLYGKGHESLLVGAYDDAADAMTKYIAIQTNNVGGALFERALAYYKSDRLDAALADLRQLQAGHPDNFQVAFASAEIAWHRHQTNEAIRNYRIFLTNAPAYAPELNAVRERLTKLGAQ